MNAVQQHYQSLLYGLRDWYIHAACTNHWAGFRDHLLEVLGWADAASAATLRHKVTGSRTKVRAGRLRKVAADNPWLAEHSQITAPYLNQRAEYLTETEREFWEEKGQCFPRKTAEQIALNRIRLIHQLGTSDIKAASEQVQLSLEIGQRVAFIEYHSVCKYTSRPTHCVMTGFLAVPGWDGWKTIRPPNGYGCLCSLRYVTFPEARESRWLTKDGEPRFETRWPNQVSRRNYDAGRFPDKGWQGPKFFADLN